MENKKILIIRLSALGDTIHTIPLASALKENYPSTTIGWIVEDKAKQFVKNNPVVDKTYVIPRKKWRKRGFSLRNFKEFLAIIRRIRREKYDIVIDTQQLFKSSIIMLFLNIKRKITHKDGREFSWLFANEFVKSDRKQFDLKYHVVKRNLDFAKYLGISDPKVKFELPLLDIHGFEKIKGMLCTLDQSKPTIALAPATTWVNKHWLESYWSKIIEEFSDKSNIIITGSKIDEPLVKRIIDEANVGGVYNFCGKTNLLELAQLYKSVNVVISPDSGSAHIAWAVNKPATVTVFSATSKDRTGPFGDNNYSIGPEIDCSPCMKRKCRLKNEQNICRAAVKPEQIINIVNNILHLS